MSFFENTRKPVGLGGKIMVAMMNLGHSPVARWGLRFLELTPDAKVLDCGCGGGANIKRLLKKCPEGIVKGIDYSPVSVEKSKKVNEAAIAEGRCTVLTSSAKGSPSNGISSNALNKKTLQPKIAQTMLLFRRSALRIARAATVIDRFVISL